MTKVRFAPSISDPRVVASFALVFTILLVISNSTFGQQPPEGYNVNDSVATASLAQSMTTEQAIVQLFRRKQSVYISRDLIWKGESRCPYSLRAL